MAVLKPDISLATPPHLLRLLLLILPALPFASRHGRDVDDEPDLRLYAEAYRVGDGVERLAEPVDVHRPGGRALEQGLLDGDVDLGVALERREHVLGYLVLVDGQDDGLVERGELLEEREVPRFAVRPKSEEGQVVQDVLQALQQQAPMFVPHTQFAIPKIILFLTEQEYESLGIEFDVNQTYDITLENQSIKFRKTV